VLTGNKDHSTGLGLSIRDKYLSGPASAHSIGFHLTIIMHPISSAGSVLEAA